MGPAGLVEFGSQSWVGLWPVYGGTWQNGCCTFCCSRLCPRHILGLFYPRMRFKAESTLNSLRAMVLHSLLVLCFESRFQPFYTDHSYISWVFLLPSQAWPTTSTGAGINRAYRSMQADRRGAGEGHCPFMGKHVPKPTPAAPHALPSEVAYPSFSNVPRGYFLLISSRQRTYQ